MKIRVKSVTYAMKSKDVLLAAGINSVVVKDLRPRGGCVYAISFADEYKDMAVRLLIENGIALHVSEQWDDLL